MGVSEGGIEDDQDIYDDTVGALGDKYVAQYVAISHLNYCITKMIMYCDLVVWTLVHVS